MTPNTNQPEPAQKQTYEPLFILFAFGSPVLPNIRKIRVVRDDNEFAVKIDGTGEVN